MSDREGLPVAGYTPQSEEKIALVNGFKQDEERLLRKLDAMTPDVVLGFGNFMYDLQGQLKGTDYDQRWLAVARTHFHEGFMALNRAVFQPQRISLPEDSET